MNLNTILWLAGSLAEAVVIGLLLYRRLWRTFPAFLIYNVWTLVGSVGAYAIFRDYRAEYLTTYTVALVVDSVLLFTVLLELAWSTLRPLRSSLPRIVPWVIGALILALGAVIWPFAAFPGAAELSRETAALMRMQQTFSILRVLVFVVLAAGSQLLSIGWRDRELQIATGLGFYSLVGLAVAMLHMHQTTRMQYSHWDRVVVASYICSMLYWVVCFSQQEAERREFTPKMQSFLLAVAGAARTTRVALADSAPPIARKQKRP